MSHITELAQRCAVTCAKTDNMRVSASKIVSDAVEYLKTSAGVMEAHEAGVDPNMTGFFTLVTTAELVSVDRQTGVETRTLALPRKFAGSLRTFQRLLQIKGDPDKDDELRREQAKADKTRRSAAAAEETVREDDDIVTKTASTGANCNSADLTTELLKTCFDRLLAVATGAFWPEWVAQNREMVDDFVSRFLATIPNPAVEPAEELIDAEILKNFSRTKWALADTWKNRYAVSEEDVERLVAAGKLRRHPKTPSTVGIAP